MKTAEEAVIGLMQLAGSDPTQLERLKQTKEFQQAKQYFQQIQLDAMKEGMRRAARICEQRYNTLETPSYRTATQA